MADDDTGGIVERLDAMDAALGRIEQQVDGLLAALTRNDDIIGARRAS